MNKCVSKGTDMQKNSSVSEHQSGIRNRHIYIYIYVLIVFDENDDDNENDDGQMMHEMINDDKPWSRTVLFYSTKTIAKLLGKG